ncbi:hypothetical protein VTL71DRAFT_3866 [Oculimacula yallundae]|uniref:Uncharacterized protein n=1 Tax=Oculimacula yallundae TaxID=86028 RepID=A0ABR4C491_9HELO
MRVSDVEPHRDGKHQPQSASRNSPSILIGAFQSTRIPTTEKTTKPAAMPLIRPKEHKWTEFELHTMLCLIAKGVHLEQRPNKRTEAPTVTRANAYENFYTALNDAVHGKDYGRDIHKNEVTRMLDQMLADRKHVVGMGGLVERQRVSRVTRALRMAWKRPRNGDFDGSETEWNQGRKEKVMLKYNTERGNIAAPVENPGEKGDTTMVDVDSIIRATQDYLMKEVRPRPVNSAGRSRWVSERDRDPEDRNTDRTPVFQTPSLTKTNLDSFRVLPENLRSLSKFDWATNPGSTRDHQARSEVPTADRPLKRAGLRTRRLSRSGGNENAGDADQPDRMRLHYESHHSSTTSRDAPFTPNKPNKHDGRFLGHTGSSYFTSTPDFGSSSSSAMGMSPEIETPTPASRYSRHPRIRSSEESSSRSFYDVEARGQKELGAALARELAGDLNGDVNMLGDLEADLTAAMEDGELMA